MVTEDYVSFETAKLLKEKGFDEKCSRYWQYDKANDKDDVDGICLCCNGFELNNSELDTLFGETLLNFGYSAPTLQMAMKWLREAHNKIIVPGISLDDRTSSTISHYIVGIWYVPANNGGAFCYTSPTPHNGYQSFEEACEAGIKYCLENLI